MYFKEGITGSEPAKMRGGDCLVSADPPEITQLALMVLDVFG